MVDLLLIKVNQKYLPKYINDRHVFLNITHIFINNLLWQGVVARCMYTLLDAKFVQILTFNFLLSKTYPLGFYYICLFRFHIHT